jgi:hypothetical protein
MMHMWCIQNLRRHFDGGFSYYFWLWKLATGFCSGCLSPAMYLFTMGLFGGREQVARQGGDYEEGSVWNWCVVFYHLSSFMGVESISVAIETLTPCRYKVKRKLDNWRTDRKTKLFGLVPKFSQTNLVWFQTCKAPKGFVSVNSISVTSWYKHITVTAKLKWRNLRATPSGKNLGKATHDLLLSSTWMLLQSDNHTSEAVQAPVFVKINPKPYKTLLCFWIRPKPLNCCDSIVCIRFFVGASTWS